MACRGEIWHADERGVESKLHVVSGDVSGKGECRLNVQLFAHF